MTWVYTSKIVIIIMMVYITTAQIKCCNKTFQAVKDSVLILSDDLVDANTAQEKCSLLGGNLAMTADPQINTTLTQIMTDKYTTDLQRVYIFFDPDKYERCKYSYSSAELDFWKSTKSLGHLWYFDLYRRNLEKAMESIYICEAWKNRGLEKWKVNIGRNCARLDGNGDWNGWNLRYSLFSDTKTRKRQKQIFIYESIGLMSGSKLRSISESFEGFTKYGGSFLAPKVNVFVGARYNTTTNGWYWSDGSPANFPVFSFKTCQQGALHYGIGWEQSSMNCSGEPAYYACQVKFNATVETFQCNASIVIVSWTGLDEFISNNNDNLTAQVEIHVLETNRRVMASYADLSTTIRNLSLTKKYNIEITAMLKGCLKANISTTKIVTTYGIPPSSCYPKVNTTAETFPCNASTVLVGWNGLDHFINENALTAQVAIDVQGWNRTISVPYSDSSATLENLLNSALHDIKVTAIVTGSINTNITSNLRVRTPGNPPPSCFREDIPTNTAMSVAKIAGLVIGLLLLLLAIVVPLVMFIRRRYSKDQPSQPEVSNPQILASPQVPDCVYQNVEHESKSNKNLFWLFEKNAESGFLLSNEFEEIQNKSKNNQRTRDVSQLPQNAARNRYKNIFPYDHARVVLQGSGGNDYINAAYIPGYDNERKFIATQGPKKETINDFWLMVWQENSNIIIMLTGLVENGKAKCEQYWPDVETEINLSSYLKVRTQLEIAIGGIVQRQFVISTTTEQRTITQLQFTTWPDHGIPVTTSNMIHLRNMVDDLQNTNAPIIVHCSAGVGRTGTYIAMDTLFNELDNKGTVNVPQIVLKMRENRKGMIQNANQYKYVYKLLMERENLKKTDKDVTEIQSMTSSEINKIQEKEFNVLSSWRFGEEWQENHPQLRTYKNTSVKVWDNRSEMIQQLDASYIQEHGSSEFFIAARNPAPGEEENFWKMIVERGASLVVDLDNSIQIPTNAALQYEAISVSVCDVNESNLYKLVTVDLRSATKAFAAQQLLLVQVKGWSDVERPPKEIDFIKIVEEMQLIRAKQNCQCVLVACSNGSTRTGTFIALVNILERLKALKRVDVFRTVKDLRDMRPNMVDNKELYKYCYSVVMHYLSDFDTYSNFK